MTQKEVSVAKLARLLELTNFTEQVNLKHKKVSVNEINRPALQLHGYFEHFAEGRVQIIGMVEFAYLQQVTQERKKEAYDKFMSFDIPCVVFCRGFQPDEDFLEAATRHNVAVLGTERATSALTAELIRRGHRLVTDDAVEIKRIDDTTLIGTSPAITRHFIELRGIGIIDVKSLYGAECVKDKQQIDPATKLEDWHKDKEYDRLGMEQEYTEFLGNKVVCHSLPIRPGRNLAVICETAAVNHRQKKMGYNAAQELYRRVQANLSKSMNPDEDDE